MSPSGLIPASPSKTLYYPEKIHWLQAIQRQICLNRSLYTVSSGKAVAGRARCAERAEPCAREWSMARRKRHLEFYSKPFIVFRARPLTVLACLAKLRRSRPSHWRDFLFILFFSILGQRRQAGGEKKKKDKNWAFSKARPLLSSLWASAVNVTWKFIKCGTKLSRKRRQSLEKGGGVFPHKGPRFKEQFKQIQSLFHLTGVNTAVSTLSHSVKRRTSALSKGVRLEVLHTFWKV